MFVTAEQRDQPVAECGAVGAPCAIDACVILAGGLRRLPIIRDTGRSALDLWTGLRGTVFDQWIRRIAPVAAEGAEVRIVHDRHTPAPDTPDEVEGLRVQVLEDRGEYRGPAGVVRDTIADLEPDATVLVTDAARWCGADLAPLLANHASHDGPITVGVNPDQTPAGVYLAPRSAFDAVPKKGFMDLKEQWLNKIRASGSPVHAFKFSDMGIRPVPDRRSVIDLARDLAGVQPPAEQADGWPRAIVPPSGVFRAVAADAEVSADALLVDAVVMPRAVVGAGAVVVRSLVCAGATVGANARLVDTVAPSRAVRVAE